MRRPIRSLAVLAVTLWITPAALAATGGPDAFGYTWADSDEPGVSFDYVFAPDSLLMLDDDYFTTSIGFDFEFYGQTYSTVTITSNGMIHFDGNTIIDHLNQPLPFESYRMIAPLWDDLNPGADGILYFGNDGQAPNRVFIAEWWAVPHYYNQGDAYFEIKLFEADNSIEFHYDDVNFDDPLYSWGASATVGIGDGSQGFALQVGYDQAVLDSYYAIRFDVPTCSDDDNDGHIDQACGGDDCNDGNPGVHPGASEVCDGICDNNCDGIEDPDEVDADSDGVSICDGDCNDGNPNIGPYALEVCNDGADNDCDGLADAADPDCSGGDDDTGDDDTGDDDTGHPGDDDDDDDTGDDDTGDDDDDDTGDDDTAPTGDDDDDAGTKNSNPDNLGVTCYCDHDEGPAASPALALLAGLALCALRRRN